MPDERIPQGAPGPGKSETRNSNQIRKGAMKDIKKKAKELKALRQEWKETEHER